MGSLMNQPANFLNEKKIILASQSPRRRQLLEWAEVPFEVIVSDTDESFPPHMPVSEAAIYIAKNKAKAVATMINSSDAHHNKVIIAADTIVVINNEILGKPNDRADAIAMLQKLSGKKHEVITGVVILYQQNEIAFADSTIVEMHPLSTTELEFYVDNYKPYDKAGAYAIQEWIGVVGIKQVQGDFYNVMGLPVSRVVQALQKL
jgi:septum formation protein